MVLPQGDPVATYVSVTDTGGEAAVSVSLDGGSAYTPVATLTGISSGDVIQVILDQEDGAVDGTVA